MRYRLELRVFLSAAYVFGCAFRAILPRAEYRAAAVWTPRLMARLLAVASGDAMRSSAAGRNRMRRTD